MKLKKWICAALSLMMLGSVCAVSAVAAEPSDFVIEGTSLIAYNGTDSQVTIPEGVTTIPSGAYVFRDNQAIESIQFPTTMKIIPANACYGVPNLKEVIIPNTTTHIKNSAFSHCDSLESITIPDNVQYILSGAFSYCPSLKNVTLPSGITYLNEQMFFNCTSLKQVDIPASVTGMGRSIFAHCTQLKTVSFSSPVPPSMMTDTLFYNCPTVDISVPSGSLTSYQEKLAGLDLTFSSRTDSSSPSADTILSASVSPSYTVHIPATVDLGVLHKGETTAQAQFAVRASDILLPEGERVIVTVALKEGDRFALATKEGASIPYTVSNGTDLSVGDNFAAFAKDGEQTGTISIDQNEISTAGAYSGTLTFTLAVS